MRTSTILAKHVFSVHLSDWASKLNPLVFTKFQSDFDKFLVKFNVQLLNTRKPLEIALGIYFCLMLKPQNSTVIYLFSSKTWTLLPQEKLNKYWSVYWRAGTQSYPEKGRSGVQTDKHLYHIYYIWRERWRLQLFGFWLKLKVMWLKNCVWYDKKD